MTFTQHAKDCVEHAGCTVIVGEQDGRQVWESHMPSAVPPELRLNLDEPECEDRRAPGRPKLAWRLANPDETGYLGWDDETHRRVGFAAAMSSKNPATADEVAAVLGVAKADLVAEAVDRGWHRAHEMDEAAAVRAANVSPQQVAAARAARRAAGK